MLHPTSRSWRWREICRPTAFKRYIRKSVTNHTCRYCIVQYQTSTWNWLQVRISYHRTGKTCDMRIIPKRKKNDLMTVLSCLSHPISWGWPRPSTDITVSRTPKVELISHFTCQTHCPCIHWGYFQSNVWIPDWTALHFRIQHGWPPHLRGHVAPIASLALC